MESIKITTYFFVKSSSARSSFTPPLQFLQQYMVHTASVPASISFCRVNPDSFAESNPLCHCKKSIARRVMTSFKTSYKTINPLQDTR